MNTKSLIFPATIAIDSREQLPYAFTGHRADARDGYCPLIIPTQTIGLKAGDYSLIGRPEIAIERKTLEDLYSTLTQGRKRFQHELSKLNKLAFAAVVVEATLEEIARWTPAYSQASGKAIVRSIIAFSTRFVRVHWFFAGDRQLGEALTFRLLERWWLDKRRVTKEPGAAA